MTSIILYGLSIFLLVLSFIKDKSKTKKALISALKSFENIMPQFLFIVVTVGILLAFLSADNFKNHRCEFWIFRYNSFSNSRFNYNDANFRGFFTW